MIHVDTPAMIPEGRQECVDGKPVASTDDRKIPVAYEEVTLTDEAAKILETEHEAAANRPARKIRRVPVAD